MRKQKSLSTIVMAVIIAAGISQSTIAQQGQQAPPRYLPPSQPKQLERQVNQPATEIAVPSILGGGPAPAATAPKPMAMPKLAAQPNPAQQQGTPKQTSPRLAPPQATSSFPKVAELPPPKTQPRQLTIQQRPPTNRQAILPPMMPRSANATMPTDMDMNAVRQTGGSSPNSLRTQQIDVTTRAKSPVIADSTPATSPTLATTTTTTTTTPIQEITPTNNTIQASVKSLINTAGPKLAVTSVGPSSITIGKTARYEINVQNLENRRAESIIVGIDFPEWIQISTSMPTTGSRELTDGDGESRMIWEIPIVEAGSTEKIVVDVIPTEPRPFDVGVEWTFKPIKGKTTIEVTQPQLSIQIAGPTEVQFGEKALYHVTVSNPGTGTAENVSVMLPEILGGERASLESIAPQQQKKFQVELIARSAGTMDLTTTVFADGNLKESDTREIIVRRADLDVKLTGPGMKYAGSTAKYSLTVSNKGDAMAKDVVAAVALPAGVEFLSGIDGVEKIDGGIRWNVGMLSPGNQRTYQMTCNMLVAGDINVEAASRGAGDLAATSSFKTKVESVADLVLSVADPKGPLPTGEEIEYKIKIVNRGTKSARGVNIVMHFSEGVEPVDANGIAHDLASGQVTFSPIAQIDPGQEISLTVKAKASQPGSHRFRAQLLCEESDSHEVAEGTTRFYGDPTSAATADSKTEPAESAGEFKR